MTPLKAEYATVSGINREILLEAGQQHDLGRQQGEEAFVKLLGLDAGGVAIPHNNWDGEPGEPMTVRRSARRELFFHPWSGTLDEDPEGNKGLKIVLSGS